jgi:hypothetical protein
VSAIGRSQCGALLALEVILQDQFAVITGEDQVDTGPLEISGEEQMRIANNDGAWRRARRNTVDMDVCARMSALAVRQPIIKSSGQAQRDTAAVKINASTTPAGLTLHIIGEALPKLSIALDEALTPGHLPTIFLLISQNWKYSRHERREYGLNFKL